VIASLLRAGLQGKSVAKLCGVSTGHVSGVRKRVAAGGFEALASRGRGGRPAKLTGRQLDRLRELHATGMSMRAMGCNCSGPCLSPGSARETRGA
jgi:transposase